MTRGERLADKLFRIGLVGIVVFAVLGILISYFWLGVHHNG